MKPSDLERRIDELFALPLEEFTKKKNALAKELSGKDRKQIKALVKPSVAVWAINQLYFKDRGTYKALVDASEKRRSAHRSALSGRKTDLHKVEAVYRSALERAFAKAIGLLEKSNYSISDATRETVRITLAGLPTDEPPGRMSRPPEPAGFSLLMPDRGKTKR